MYKAQRVVIDSEEGNDAVAATKMHKVVVNGISYMYPAPTKIQLEWLKEAHDTRHGGIALTQGILRAQDRHWPYQVHHIKEIIDQCMICMQWKRIKPSFVPTHSHTIARTPFQNVQLDFLSGLPVTRAGNCELLVIICTLTKFVILLPLKNKTTETIARALFKLWCLIGPPAVYQADNEATLWGDSIQKMKLLFGVLDRRIAAYQPTKNGKVERNIAEVKTLLHKLTAQHGVEWDQAVHLVQLSLNTSASSSNLIPFELVFAKRCHPFGTTVAFPVIDNHVDDDKCLSEWNNHVAAVQQFLFPYLREAKQHVALVGLAGDKLGTTFNKVLDAPPLEPGMAVRVRNTQLKTPGNKNKTPVEAIGTIVRSLGKDTYEIRDRSGMLINRAIPTQQMQVMTHHRPEIIESNSKTEAEAEEIKNQEAPAEKEEDDGEFFTLENIVRQRATKRGGVLKEEFLCKWAGYDEKENTWEPASNLPADMVAAFIKKENETEGTKAKKARIAKTSRK